MARLGIIAGSRTDKLIAQMSKSNAIKIDAKWKTIKDLMLVINRNPVEIINSMEAILIMDAGFKNSSDTQASARELLSLQDLMVSNNFDNVKLYFITKNNDLFELLKVGLNGMEGMHYKNAEMFYIKNAFTIAYAVKILQGTMDKTGVYSSKRDTQSKIERLESEKRALIEDSQRVSKESIEYGSKEPVSEINQEDILGTKKNQEMMKKREMEERRLEREIESLKKKQAKSKGKNPKLKKLEQEYEELTQNTVTANGKDVELIIDTNNISPKDDVISKSESPEKSSKPFNPNEGAIIVENGKVINKKTDNINMVSNKNKPLIERDITVVSSQNSKVPTIAELTELYKRLSSTDNDTEEQKLKSDKGVISVIGTRGVGVSGFIAQTADVYAMLGRKVLIIDLDILMRSQTIYFPTYSDAVAQHKGVSNSLVRLTQLNQIKSNAVPVTSRIDVLSNEKMNEIIPEGFHSTITNIFDNVIDEAREHYDIILIDLPLNYLSYYLRHSDKIDKNVFVLPNKFYEIEDFFSIQLQEIIDAGDIFSNDLLSKSNIVLNKYRNDFRDLEGYQLNRLKIKELLLDAGNPYDSIPVLGEIPEYKDWEEQYATKIRYVWTDDLALGVYRKIISRIL